MRWSGNDLPRSRDDDTVGLCGALCVPSIALVAIFVIVTVLFRPAPENIGVRADFGTAEIAEMSR